MNRKSRKSSSGYSETEKAEKKATQLARIEDGISLINKSIRQASMITEMANKHRQGSYAPSPPPAMFAMQPMQPQQMLPSPPPMMQQQFSPAMSSTYMNPIHYPASSTSMAMTDPMQQQQHYQHNPIVSPNPYGNPSMISFNAVYPSSGSRIHM